MKHLHLLLKPLCLFCLITNTCLLSAQDSTAFITTWEVSGFERSISIRSIGSGYNYNVDWGDDSVSIGLTGTARHSYIEEGIYTVSITGDFPRFAISSDNLRTVEQWGNIGWTSMEDAFAGASKMTYNATNAPDLSAVKGLRRMFAGAENFNGAIGNWNTSTVEDMGAMFLDAISFNQPIGEWNTGNVTNMIDMFNGASSFNQDIGAWNTDSLIGISRMFLGASAFNQDIGNWNTSNVKHMISVFAGATTFDQDISRWDTKEVTTMGSMFERALSFNQDISSWNLTNMESLDLMFLGAVSFNQDLSAWNTSKVRNMQGMFLDADAFNQLLGNWDIGEVLDMQAMLSGSGMDQAHYDSTLIGWANQEVQQAVKLGAEGLRYCEGEAARNLLVDQFSWSITGDEKADDCISTNISNTLQAGLLIFPNPSQGKIFLRPGAAWPGKEVHLRIVNPLGQEVYKTRCLLSAEMPVDLKSLPTGNYYLLIEHAEGRSYQKLQIE